MGLYQGSFTPLDSDIVAADVAIRDTAGNQLSGFDQSRPANATLTSVVASASSGVLLAANPARRYFVMRNESGKNLSIAFAATATTTAYTILIASNSTYESPLNGYTGVISGIWSGADGKFVRITEVTT